MHKRVLPGASWARAPPSAAPSPRHTPGRQRAQAPAATSAWPGPLPGWERPLILTRAVGRWLLVATAPSLGPHPRPQAPRGASADETTLCPRFSLSQSPPLRVLPHREHVFQVGDASQPTTLQKQEAKQKTLLIFVCVPKTVDMQAQHPQDQAVA